MPCEGKECEVCRGGDLDSIIHSKILERGWTTIVVPSEEEGKMSIVYTVGLSSAYNHPEFIAIGDIGVESLIEIVNSAVDALKEGTNFERDRADGVAALVKEDGESVPASIGCRMISKASLEQYMPVAKRVIGDQCQAIQLVLFDENGHLPWERSCDPEWKSVQILL